MKVGIPWKREVKSIPYNQLEISILIIGDGKCQMLPQFSPKSTCVLWKPFYIYPKLYPKIIYITRREIYFVPIWIMLKIFNFGLNLFSLGFPFTFLIFLFNHDFFLFLILLSSLSFSFPLFSCCCLLAVFAKFIHLPSFFLFWFDLNFLKLFGILVFSSSRLFLAEIARSGMSDFIWRKQ